MWRKRFNTAVSTVEWSFEVSCVVDRESLSLVVHRRRHHGAGRDHAAGRHSGSHASAGVRVGTQIGRATDDDLGRGTARRLRRIDSGSNQEIIKDVSYIIGK